MNDEWLTRRADEEFRRLVDCEDRGDRFPELARVGCATSTSISGAPAGLSLPHGACRPMVLTAFVGRDRGGNWISGLFVNRAQVVKCALIDNGHVQKTSLRSRTKSSSICSPVRTTLRRAAWPVRRRS